VKKKNLNNVIKGITEILVKKGVPQKKINNKYQQIQNQRNYSDKEILNLFKDEIAVPRWVISKESNTFFNKFLNLLSRLTRKFI